MGYKVNANENKNIHIVILYWMLYSTYKQLGHCFSPQLDYFVAEGHHGDF